MTGRLAAQVEKLDDPILPVARIVQRCPAEQLMGVYKIPAFEGAEGLLQEISMVRGKLLPGGLPNVEAAARIVLQVGTENILNRITDGNSRLLESRHIKAQKEII